MARAMLQMLYEGDVRDVLPAIRVSTLIVSHADSARIPVAHSRYLAEHIAGARYVELPGEENLPWAGDQARLVSEVQEFLTGVRPHEEPDRVLATVLFTDIVGSTQRAAELGDQRWRSVFAAVTVISSVLDRVMSQARGRLMSPTRGQVMSPVRGGLMSLALDPGTSPVRDRASVRAVARAPR